MKKSRNNYNKSNNNSRKRPPRNDAVSCSRLFWCALFVIFNFLLLASFTLSTFRLLFNGTFRPALWLRWPLSLGQNPEATVDSLNAAVSVREVVMLPDQVLVFLNYSQASSISTKDDLDCFYFSAHESSPSFKQRPLDVDGEDPLNQIVRCPLHSGDGFRVSVSLRDNGGITAAVPTYSWESLAYDALIDHDNTTIMFVKGLNLRPDRVSDPSRFECLYGWDFSSSKYLLKSDVVSIAQEIVRCRTPLSVLRTKRGVNDAVKVSVRLKGRGIINSIARPGIRPALVDPPRKKLYTTCLCSMVRNQGRFMKEWVMYHAQMGVQRWFIYDNNSDDDIDVVIELLQSLNYNITRHVWPWVKTQEAGFAHCALRARHTCQWVGFIDVDEFFHMPSGLMLQDVLRNQSKYSYVGEVRTSCYSFGPSHLKKVPAQGVTVGYTCRLAAPERHKSIVRPEVLDSTLVNVVHHFHLRNGYEAVNVDRGILVINHYKYQVWEVFKEKFYRRVATYVADWQEEQNVGSKDRAPGLGTKAVEPADWSERFCEVNDTGLRNRVLKNMADPVTMLLPWQKGYQKHVIKRRGRRKSRRKHRGLMSSSKVGDL